jgi:iron complex outermembrane receptor protein
MMTAIFTVLGWKLPNRSIVQIRFLERFLLLLPAFLAASIALAQDGASTGQKQLPVTIIASKGIGTDTTPSLEPIVVTAHKEEDGSAENGYRAVSAQFGPMGEVPVKDIPFSLNVTSGASIDNRSAHILADALRPNPAAMAVQQPHTDGRGGSELTIRGFDPCYLLDGLIMRNMLPVRTENIDRIEVIHGLSGFLYGFGTPGGTINIVRKKPGDEAGGSFSAGQYNGGVNFLSADCLGPVTSGKALSFRVTSFLEDGRSFTENSSQRGSYLSGSIDFKPVASSRIKVSASHQDLSLRGQQAAFALDPAKVTVPSSKEIDATRLYGQTWSNVKGRQEIFSGSAESKLGNTFSLRGAYLYSMLWRKNNGVSAALIDNAGSYRATYSDGAPSDVNEHAANAFIDASVRTWKIHHRLTAGWMLNSFLQANNPVSLRNIVIDTFSIAHPASAAMPDTVAPVSETQHGRSTYNSAIVGDMLSCGMLTILAGANYTKYDYKNENIDTGLIKKFSQNHVSPSIAVAVKPASFISTYASYMQGITAGGFTTTPYAKNVNEVLPPAVNDQLEAGIKVTVFHNLDLSAAGFRINKINEYLDPVDSLYKQTGREIHKGLELTAGGKLFDRLTIGGGGTLLAALVTKAADKTIENKTPANIPKKSATIFLEYDIPAIPGVSISGQACYNGRRWIDAKNTASIPSTVIFDAGFRYRPPIDSRRLVLTIHITNLLNTSYWAAYKPTGTVGLCLGAPRTVSLSIKYAW